MAPHERVLVDKAILDDPNHGDLACDACHGGDPKSQELQAAHRGVKRDPSFPAPGACAECHPQEAEHYAQALHSTLTPMRRLVLERGDHDPQIQKKLNQAFDTHCASCHASCGQCHVSRPAAVEGGLLAGHGYEKKANQKLTCTACHGSRVGDEYFGKSQGGQPDVHSEQARLTCQKCHKAAELHGDGQGYPHRLEVANGPRCLDCHPDIYTEKSPNAAGHQAHKGRVACQACHAQPYANCFGCHVKKDSQGRKYYQVQAHRQDFRIGLNPQPSSRRPEKFVVLRHVPVAPGSFDFYAKSALKNFDRFPTWKPATPHNIRRRTVQNGACANCHGNGRFFLKEEDVEKPYRQANRPVVVPPGMIPAALKPDQVKPGPLIDKEEQ